MIKAIHFFGPDRNGECEIMRIESSWGDTRHRIPYTMFHDSPASIRTAMNRPELINAAITEHTTRSSF